MVFYLLWTPILSIFHMPSPSSGLAEVPAATAQRMRLGEVAAAKQAKNASRQTWSMFNRQKVGWPVKLRKLNYDPGNGTDLPMTYIAPSDLVTYLMADHPEVLCGGFTSIDDRGLHLQSFWEGFRLAHGDHEVFKEHGDNLGQVIPLVWHGDEGRGKRRGNTAVVSCGTPLSIFTAVNAKKRRLDDCACNPPAQSLRKYPAVNRRLSGKHLAALRLQATTMKGHSFLHRFPLFIIPSAVHHEYPGALEELLKIIARDLRRLFFEGFDAGGRHYAVAVLGALGDLKWFKKIALERSWENKGTVRNIACCHECGAGVDNVPMEDMSETPVWAPTRYHSRPWTNPPVMLPVPICNAIPEKQYKRDPFHFCKVGIYRDLAASCLLWLVSKNYFGGQGDINDKLATAHAQFRQHCRTTGKSPALRTFTRALMMFPRLDAYPWANTKGSDTMLLLSWLHALCNGFVNAPMDASHVPMLKLMTKTCEAAKAVFAILNQHRLWMEPGCGMMQHAAMQRFVTGYMMMASRSLNDSFNGWAVKPKLHLFKHEVLDLHETLSRGDELILNWNTYNCEQWEDLVGRTCRLSRRLDSRRIGERVLGCYLLKAAILHRRFRRINRI